jgi:hypothetical protein
VSNSHPEEYLRGMRAMQDTAFERIQENAEQYVAQDHATAVYVQEALLAARISQKYEDEALLEREVLMQDHPGDIILFPDEFRDLRIRAAYHGAGVALEPLNDLPRPIRHRLSDNLSNYPPEIEYEQHLLPWTYRFKPGSLKSILLHDFKIAAQDSADGDLHRISHRQDKED